MSTASERLRAGAAGLLVRLYPESWRRRYGLEVLALVEEDPPNARGLASLVVGAADAHLRPRRSWSVVSPQTRMRLSIGAVFCCWIVMSLNGIGFQKDTEEASYAGAGRHHPLLAVSHDAIVVGALLGCLAIAVGGLPLVWQALRQAYTERDRRLALALLSPALAVAAFAALTWLLVEIAPQRHGHFPLSFVLLFQAPWRIGGWAGAAVCALAPRVVMSRVEMSARALRRASFAAVVLTIAMAAIAVGLTAYACALPLQAGSLAGQSTAPIGASTGTMLALYALSAWIAGGLGLIACRRALGGALARS